MAHTEELEDEEEDLTSVAEEQREILTVYHHCWDDDKVDIHLTAMLLFNILSSKPEGKLSWSKVVEVK